MKKLETITLCIESGDSSTCTGKICPKYQSCYKIEEADKKTDKEKPWYEKIR